MADYPQLRRNLEIKSPNDNLGFTTSCMNCSFFDELGGTYDVGGKVAPETCSKFKARPPARVIAFGCSEYIDNEEIPF